MSRARESAVDSVLHRTSDEYILQWRSAYARSNQTRFGNFAVDTDRTERGVRMYDPIIACFWMQVARSDSNPEHSEDTNRGQSWNVHQKSQKNKIYIQYRFFNKCHTLLDRTLPTSSNCRMHWKNTLDARRHVSGSLPSCVIRLTTREAPLAGQ